MWAWLIPGNGTGGSAGPMGTIAFGHVLVSPSDPGMQRLSIARSLRLALIAPTLVLAAAGGQSRPT